MIRSLALSFFALLFHSTTAQNFTWMKGSNTGGQSGLYGSQGVPTSTNNPGCRHGSATWVDTQGNLWLFGGEGFSSTNTLCWLNDLWKYDIQTNEWTWISGANTADQPGTYGTQGVASATNHPGAREFMMSWTDNSGNFWLFGGDGFASTTSFGKLNDLWKYNPVTNQWTWMKGSNTVDQNGIYGTQGVANAANSPGSRGASGSWIDNSGNLWIFGGRGLPVTGTSYGFLNDLWRYNPANNQWTWVGGSNLASQFSVHGTLNVGAASNLPGGVEFPACWTHGTDLYLFGGRGLPASGGAAYLNAFWKYTPSLNQWTWIGGSNAGLATGDYGTLGVASSTNMPGARMSAAAWNDGGGNLWLFGGEGNASTVGVGSLNDMFYYSVTNNTWTWIKGSNTINQLGQYGTQTVASPTNMPGARYYNSFWPLSNGKFWLMGGLGYSTSTLADNMEDLWKFTPSCYPEVLTAVPGNTLCHGNSVTLSAVYSGSNAVSWFTQPIGGTSVASGIQLITTTLQALTSNSVYLYYTEVFGCSNYPRTPISLTVEPGPSLVLNSNSPICSGEQFTCGVSGTAISFTWSNGSIISPLTQTLTSNTTFTITGTGSNGCSSESNITATVFPLPQISILGTSSLCSGNSAILTASGTAVSYSWSTGSTNTTVLVQPNNTAVYQLSGTDANSCKATVSHTMDILPLPVLSIDSESVICSGEQTSLVANGALSYTWNSGQTGSSITVSPQNTAIYSVTGSAANSCTNSAQITLSVSACLAIESQKAPNEPFFSVYPNPSQGVLSIKTDVSKDKRIIVLNSLGQIVFQSDTETEVIQVHLAQGLYVCTLYSGQEPIKSLKVLVN